MPVSMETMDTGIPTANTWYRQSITKNFVKDQDHTGDNNQLHIHQFTNPPVHRAENYRPSAPYIQAPFNQTSSLYVPPQHPPIANRRAGYPSTPYPGSATKTNMKVDPALEEGDNTDQETDEEIKKEMARLRE